MKAYNTIGLVSGILVASLLAATSGNASACPSHGSYDGMHSSHPWAYEGPVGPKNWGKLSPDYKVCKVGKTQSPVNLNTSKVDLNATPPAINYQPGTFKVKNKGHAIEVSTRNTGNFIRIYDKEYDFVQVHMHTPSEHTVNGKKFPMELHFVNKAKDGKIAVMGVFVKEGAENPALKKILEILPQAKDEFERTVISQINLNNLLPRSSALFRYSGSLTTPPCTEGVAWTVFEQPVEASKAQIAALKAVTGQNARPIQRLKKGRVVERF